MPDVTQRHWFPVVAAGAPLLLLAALVDWRAAVALGAGGIALRFAPRPAEGVKAGLLLAAILAVYAAPPLWGRRNFAADTLRWAAHGFSNAYLLDDIYAPAAPTFFEALGIIQEETTPDDRIMVFGHSPLFYFIADRAPASRFYWPAHAFVVRRGVTTPPQVARFREEAEALFVQEFLASRPLFVIVEDVSQQSVAPTRDLTKVPAIQDELRRAYAVRYTGWPYQVFKRKPATDGA